MKMIVVVALALVAAAAALPVDNKEPAVIVESENKQNENGYQYGFKTSDGTSRKEEGELKDILDEEQKPQKALSVRGSYSYLGPDGNEETIEYYADNTGYHASGPSVPKSVSRR